jgi:hypothetical protein
MPSDSTEHGPVQYVWSLYKAVLIPEPGTYKKSLAEKVSFNDSISREKPKRLS